jgi:hypothetical protein
MMQKEEISDVELYKNTVDWFEKEIIEAKQILAILKGQINSCDEIDKKIVIGLSLSTIHQKILQMESFRVYFEEKLDEEILLLCEI